MATFTFKPEVTDIKVVRKPIAIVCDFDLPDAQKESLPASEVAAINGYFVLNFYTTPSIGHLVQYRGHLWRVDGVLHAPSKFLTRKQAPQVTMLAMTYLGPETQGGPNVSP